MTRYIGTIVIDVEVQAVHVADAFDQLFDKQEEVEEALRNDGVEYLFADIGGGVHEYQED
jgi:hypothetical protein